MVGFFGLVVSSNSGEDYSRTERLCMYHMMEKNLGLMCRTAIVHSLKGLGDAVPISVTVPGSTGLWEFTQQPLQRLEVSWMAAFTIIPPPSSISLLFPQLLPSLKCQCCSSLNASDF